jgi:4-amino-4-deoxy-L-arabinose transferase-like glycosyltransferase
VSDLAERYGAPSRARRPLVLAAVALLALLALAWLGWVILVQSRPQVTSQLLGYSVHGQHAARATFTVERRDASVRASCLLRAFAADHSVVGERTVAVTGRTGEGGARLVRTVRTERQATTVDLAGCTAAGQRSPR